MRAEDPPLLPFYPTGLKDPSALASNQPSRIRLFDMMPGFLWEPTGLDTDEPTNTAEPDDGPNWLQVSAGNDNPFFDLRQPFDPGGVGYYRLYSQMQLFDSSSTACSLGLQGYTPAGRDSYGVVNGPTVFSPSFSVFHDLGGGMAIQGFAGRNMNLNSAMAGQPHQGVRYGVALQRPLGEAWGLEQKNVYFFVETLGRFHPAGPNTAGPVSTLDVLPGIHWRLTDTWWLSSGVSVPIMQTPDSSRLWQITCSFRF